jgi:hypothetical protein
VVYGRHFAMPRPLNTGGKELYFARITLAALTNGSVAVRKWPLPRALVPNYSGSM